jgi:hypothetical protein
VAGDEQHPATAGVQPLEHLEERRVEVEQVGRLLGRPGDRAQEIDDVGSVAPQRVECPALEAGPRFVREHGGEIRGESPPGFGHRPPGNIGGDVADAVRHRPGQPLRAIAGGAEDGSVVQAVQRPPARQHRCARR